MFDHPSGGMDPNIPPALNVDESEVLLLRQSSASSGSPN